MKEIKFLQKHDQDRIVFNSKKLFIVNGLSKEDKSGIFMTVVCLDSGETLKEFLAVSLDSLEDKSTTNLCTSVKVEGDVLLLTTSHGNIPITTYIDISNDNYYPSGFPGYSEQSADQLFLIDWVKEEVISSWRVPHSPFLKAAVKYKLEETDPDYEALDYDEDDGENIAKIETRMTMVGPDEFYVLHGEVVMPEMGDLRELDDWGHYVQIWRVRGKQSELVFSKRDVKVISITRNLFIYEELTNLLQGLAGRERFGTTLVNFQDVGKTVHWLNLESQKDCHQQVFCSDFLPLHTSTVREDGTIQVLQLFFEENTEMPGGQYEARFIMFDLDMKETTQTGRVVHFPKLLHGNEIGDNFDLELLSDGKVYFSHQVFGWSNGNLNGVIPLSKRMLVVEEGEEEPNIEVNTIWKS